MASTSYPHNDQTVGEPGWRQLVRLWRTSGVIGGQGQELEVTADGATLAVTVGDGSAFVEAFLFELDPAEVVGLATADAGADRYDRVVLRYDPAATATAGAVTLAVLTGTPGAGVPPALTQVVDGVWEVALATVLVTAAGSTIAPGDVTDERTYARSAVVTLTLEGYREPRTDLGNVSGTVVLDLAAAQHYTITPTAAVEVQFTGLPEAGYDVPGSLVITTAAHPVTWQAGTAHPEATAPELAGETWLSLVAQPTRVVVGTAWQGVA